MTFQIFIISYSLSLSPLSHSGPEVIKLFPGPEAIKIFMLISPEHEILNAHKFKNIKKLSMFQALMSIECYFFLLIKVEMPTTVGISTFISRKNSILS